MGGIGKKPSKSKPIKDSSRKSPSNAVEEDDDYEDGDIARPNTIAPMKISQYNFRATSQETVVFYEPDAAAPQQMGAPTFFR